MDDLSSIDLADLSLFAEGAPWATYRRLRDDAPVHWNHPRPHTPGGEGFWSLTRYDDVQWAATQPDLFSSEGLTVREGGGTLIANLARLEIRLVLDQLLDRVDSVELTGEVERTRSNKHAGFRHVPVALTEAANTGP